MRKKKEVISNNFLYFYSKSFFSILFLMTWLHILYQELLICFQIFIFCIFSHLEPCLSSFLLDGTRNSKCALLDRTHICALGINFCKVGKIEREDVKLQVNFFSYFVKKNKNGKAELLEMLQFGENQHICSLIFLASLNNSLPYCFTQVPDLVRVEQIRCGQCWRS